MCDPKLPEVDEYGNLPPGIHNATLAEIGQRFGRFQKSDCRPNLMEKLRKYVEEVNKGDWKVSVIIDGSFVMSKVDEPDDIDVVLVLPANWDMKAVVKPFEYNVLSKRYVRRQYGFDVFVVRERSKEFEEWSDFFAQVNPKWNKSCKCAGGLKKGIVRIVT